MGKVIDLTGQRFGRLTVVGRDNTVQSGGAKWNCLCDCGNTVSVRSDALRQHKTVSCGCYNKDEKHSRLVDLVGKRFDKLTVIEFAGMYTAPGGSRTSRWLCQCDCGNQIVMMQNRLKAGRRLSCGCDLKLYLHNKRSKDITGQRFGKLVARQQDGMIGASAAWIFDCDCGGTIRTSLNHLTMGKTTSCGCQWKETVQSHNDLTNMQFGDWTVLQRYTAGSSDRTYWLCRCKCNREFPVRADRLKDGSCSKCAYCSGYAVEDIVGRKFNMLTVKRFVERTADKHNLFECVCDCGNVTVVESYALRHGITKSCGCMHSSGEQRIKAILQARKIEYKSQYTFEDLRGPNGGMLQFDFGIMQSNKLIGLIEYQGIQHYINTEFGRMQREITDQQKKEYCSAHNIALYEIRYDEDIDSSLDTILNALHANPVPVAD